MILNFVNECLTPGAYGNFLAIFRYRHWKYMVFKRKDSEHFLVFTFVNNYPLIRPYSKVFRIWWEHCWKNTFCYFYKRRPSSFYNFLHALVIPYLNGFRTEANHQEILIWGQANIPNGVLVLKLSIFECDIVIWYFPNAYKRWRLVILSEDAAILVPLRSHNQF